MGKDMQKREKEQKTMCNPSMWLDGYYPTTIVSDRYNGTYSGGQWLAFACDYWDVPDGVDGGDTECESFWNDNEYAVGRGSTPQEAFDNLKELMTTKNK